jgi:hypothetical protein
MFIGMSTALITSAINQAHRACRTYDIKKAMESTTAISWFQRVSCREIKAYVAQTIVPTLTAAT